VHAELLEDVLEVLADRTRGQTERGADLAVRLPFGHERQHVSFARAQVGHVPASIR
jgi:hypothetical protein